MGIWALRACRLSRVETRDQTGRGLNSSQGEVRQRAEGETKRWPCELPQRVKRGKTVAQPQRTVDRTERHMKQQDAGFQGKKLAGWMKRQKGIRAHNKKGGNY
ncbi:ubiquitin conjugation factor E4 [Corchorus olitorius]|uniref:Ubiquitin conjugation factor E4 n=1 Tax=Corchorus olitorius TaxID=93759 RepID=A0A1R3KIP4_9ROSI|nr:ubiquitin conjugation factor E4 [Corchorus olitorius]